MPWPCRPWPACRRSTLRRCWSTSPTTMATCGTPRSTSRAPWPGASCRAAAAPSSTAPQRARPWSASSPGRRSSGSCFRPMRCRRSGACRRSTRPSSWSLSSRSTESSGTPRTTSPAPLRVASSLGAAPPCRPWRAHQPPRKWSTRFAGYKRWVWRLTRWPGRPWQACPRNMHWRCWTMSAKIILTCGTHQTTSPAPWRVVLFHGAAHR
mmetsp:Transcript_5219/g.15377  ORF Transcript_5219/g.15377 Transcript_5219/m.15377 type:complete len:209 (+) Transcript_5219:254-880(+)